ncbi:MAG: hypothetical protein AB1830_13140 [Pseudomonadota bacterium]
MLIRCKLLREGGTKVQIADREYHFQPIQGGDPNEHVCEVTHEGDLARLLEIKEGYEIHPSELRKAKPPQAPKSAPAPQPDGKKGYGAMSREELFAEYERRGVKRPHHATKTEKLIAGLEALDEAAS